MCVGAGQMAAALGGWCGAVGVGELVGEVVL